MNFCAVSATGEKLFSSPKY